MDTRQSGSTTDHEGEGTSRGDGAGAVEGAHESGARRCAHSRAHTRSFSRPFRAFCHLPSRLSPSRRALSPRSQGCRACRAIFFLFTFFSPLVTQNVQSFFLHGKPKPSHSEFASFFFSPPRSVSPTESSATPSPLPHTPLRLTHLAQTWTASSSGSASGRTTRSSWSAHRTRLDCRSR